MKVPSWLTAQMAIVCAIGVVAAPRPHAQAAAATPQADASFTYEVASVRRNTSAPPGSSIRRFPGGRLQATNMPLRALITFAYQLQPYQLAGDPDWIGEETFDIVAKMEGDPPPVPPGQGVDPHMIAMRELLADRFKLTVHRETREMEIYALIRARDDGTLGPALKPTTQDCAAMAAARGGPPPAPSGPNSPVVCGIRLLPGRLIAGAMPMSLLARNLSGQVQRTVVDRTGLDGAWDFEMTFAAERPLNLPPGVELPPADPDAPSLFTAMQEQLGLKLQSTKGLVEVLVIDTVERPVPDQDVNRESSGR